MHALVWGFFVLTVLLWHGTFTINSLAHMVGRRRYRHQPTTRATTSLLAVITMGEGWHNNHHHYQSSAAQGFFWWEMDSSYYILRGLSALGMVWDLPATARRHAGAGPRGGYRQAGGGSVRHGGSWWCRCLACDRIRS